jgi:cob(I)alamin adenosyltransferase
MTDKKGLILVNTGPGKGKTTAALGAALRAAGAGLKVLIIQFVKGGGYSEIKAIEAVPNIEVRSLGGGMIGRSQDLEPHRHKARDALETAQSEAESGHWDMLILDEVCWALHKDLIPVEAVLELLRHRPPGLHMILTGRFCPQEILNLADTITRMKAVKHHFESGVKAQAGIEY